MDKKSNHIDAGVPFSPNYLLDYLNQIQMKTIKQGNQQDSQEFLGWILEALSSEMLKTTDTIQQNIDNEENEKRMGGSWT